MRLGFLAAALALLLALSVVGGLAARLTVEPGSLATFTIPASGVRSEEHNGEVEGGAGSHLGTPSGTVPPSGLTASFHHSSLPAVDLAWRPVEGAVYYNIYRASAPGGPYQGIGSSHIASYLDTGVVEGATYYYVVTAVNGGGSQSRESNEVQAFTGPGPVTPAPTPEATPAPSSAPTAEPTPEPRPKPASTPTPTRTWEATPAPTPTPTPTE